MSVVGLPLGATADGSVLPGTGPQSVQSPIDALAANPGVIPIYLLIASPWDPDASATTTLYYSTGPFTTDSTDTPPDQVFTEDKIAVPINLTNSITLERGVPRATGPTAGDILFDTMDPDDRNDGLAAYAWDGRDVRVLLAFEGYRLSECAEIFKGTAEGASWNEHEVRVRLRSPRFRLERPVQTNTYAGATSVTATDLAFTSPDTITSTSTDLSVFAAGDVLQALGSDDNNGFFVAESSTATTLTVESGITTEAAGDSVTIRTALQGDESLKGKYRPLVYGQVRQVQPVLVNGTLLAYQVHDGSVEAIGAVRDRGIEFDFAADYATASLLLAASIPAGEYATSIAEGLIRLGATPSGIVTADVQGDDSGSLGYVSTAADIIRKIATTQGPLTDPDDLDTGTFADLNTETSAVVGVSTGLESTTTAEVLDSVAASVGAFLDFTRNGRLRVVRLVNPTTTSTDKLITSIDRETFGGRQADIPAHKIKLGYRRYPQTLNGEEVAGSVGDSTRFDFGQEYRTVEGGTAAESATILEKHPSAAAYEVQTLLDTEADAQTEADRLQALHSPSRHRYAVGEWGGLFAYELGDVVELEVPRYDLTNGQKFVVLGYTEAPIQSPEVHENKVGLTLWGRE